MAKKRSSSNTQTKKSPDGTGLLVLELQEIHSAETQLSRVLPKYAKVVESETLRKMLGDRLSEGERILEEVDGALGTLEQSDSLTAPNWQPAPIQDNPQILSTTELMKFFRVRADQ